MGDDPGTATPGEDYTPASGTVEFSPGISFATIYVGTLADSVTDPGETFSVIITSVIGDACPGSLAVATVTMYDQPTSISVSSPGTVNEGQDFNLQAAVSPPAMYMISGTVNWGTSPGMGSESFTTMTNADGQFSLPHQYWDDGESPGNGTSSDSETITVTIGSLVGTTTATVANVAPTGSDFQLINESPLGGPTWRVEGFIQDVLPNGDVLDVTIDWGDDSAPTVLEGLPPTSSIYQEHTYPHDGQTYNVQVTVEDDDTGQWLWSKALEMYLLDVDVDSDNDGEISADDELVEAFAPGAYIGVNKDDDDQNEVADMNQVGPITGENDLEEIRVAFTPSNNPQVNNYLGWYVGLVPYPGPALDASTFEVDPAGAVLYGGPDKSDPASYIETPYGRAVVWVVGSGPISETLYVEARAAGFMSFTLHLMNPNWFSVDTDSAVMTALENSVNLTIYNGQFGGAVAEANEETVGAFTVANLNDTDGDGIQDLVDDVVLANTQPITGVDEVDLMKLVVDRPANYIPGTAVELFVHGSGLGAINFWALATKQIPLTDFASGFVMFDEGQAERIAWVEKTFFSVSLRQHQIEARYRGASDTVALTAVWATQGDYIAGADTALTPEQIFGMSPWNEIPEGHSIRQWIDGYGGVGIRPVMPAPFGVSNVIVQQWKVYPPGIQYVPQVRFDLTRRKEGDIDLFPAGGGLKIDHFHEDFPVLLDEANDDIESNQFGPNANQRMFVLDAPGIETDMAPEGLDRLEMRGNFEEFVRIDVNGQQPAYNGLQGSRASYNFDWHTQLTLERDSGTGKWKRENPESIGEDHIFVPPT